MLSPDTILQQRYRIVRQLGQGGMGAVYEAIDERLDTVVALKETLFADERLRKQFEREARLLARLHHPALPRVSDHFAERDGQFLVMQYIAGEDLAEMLREKNGPFAQEEVLRWADQLCDALDYLHTQDPQIIHRDIKPQNLKLTAEANKAAESTIEKVKVDPTSQRSTTTKSSGPRATEATNPAKPQQNGSSAPAHELERNADRARNPNIIPPPEAPPTYDPLRNQPNKGHLPGAGQTPDVRTFPNGTRVVKQPDGTRIVIMPNGATRVFPPGEKPIRRRNRVP